MDTIKAAVVESGGKHSLKIATAEGISIPLSDGDANEVKRAFNKLVQRVKDGVFQIKLDPDGDDLFHDVSREYLTQLNREIQDVHKEMQRFGLVPK